MTGLRERDVRALASAQKEQAERASKTAKNIGETILLYNRIDARAEDAPDPGNAKTNPMPITAGAHPQIPEPEIEHNAEPDSFGEGAPPRALRELPRNMPFPTHELLACAAIPAPTRLDKEAADRELVFALIVAYRAACAEFFPKSKARKWGKYAPDITQLKAYPQLVAAACALVAENIPPALWAAWSFDNAAVLAKEKLEEPPTIGFVFSEKRVKKFTGWYLSEVWWEAGRRPLIGPLAQSCIDRFRRAEAEYRVGSAPVDAVLAVHFPETYSVAVARAKAEGERAQEKLRRRAAVGEHIWCLKYARVMKLAGLELPYTHKRISRAKSSCRSAKK
jgi:hypothetical protein